MSHYKKILGLWDLVSFGVGGTIGSGIFVVPGIAAGIAGPGSLLAWLLVAISATCVMLSLGWASSKFPSTGAFYSIYSNVFGKHLSTTIVFFYLISAVFGIATIAAGIGQYVFYLGYQDVLWIEIGIIVFFGIVNMIGTRPSGNIEMVLTLLKTIPLIILAFLLLPHMKHENFTPFFTGNTGDFLRTVIIVYWCFTGFEISAIPADETKNKNDIFRSLVIVMLVVTFVYLFLNISLIGTLGSQLIASSPAPMAEAASIAFADSGNIMAYIGIIAMMSALNAYLLATSRVLQNISYTYNLPFVPDIGKNGTPYAAIMISTIAGASLLFFSNHFEQLATISVITTLLPYLFICASALKMFDSFTIRIISILGVLSTLAILAASLF
jgi:amino acid transporter